MFADIDDIITKVAQQNLREKEVQSIRIQHLSKAQQSKITILEAVHPNALAKRQSKVQSRLSQLKQKYQCT